MHHADELILRNRALLGTARAARATTQDLLAVAARDRLQRSLRDRSDPLLAYWLMTSAREQARRIVLRRIKGAGNVGWNSLVTRSRTINPIAI